MHRGAQFWPIRPLGDPKTQLTLGHGADAHLGHGNGGHPHLHGPAASEEVAHGVGVEHVERWHLEKLARLRRGIAAIDEKIFRYLGGLTPFEKAVPGIGLARQNHVAGGRVLADENWASPDSREPVPLGGNDSLQYKELLARKLAMCGTRRGL